MVGITEATNFKNKKRYLSRKKGEMDEVLNGATHKKTAKSNNYNISFKL